MRRVSSDVATTIALVVAAGLLTSCVGSGSDRAADSTATASTSSAAVAQSATPATGRKTTPPPVPSPTGTPARGKHNQADVAFAVSFVRHHAQGIEMAKIVLAKAYIDPAVLNVASRIKSEQVPQIGRLRGWLAGWDEPVPAPNGSPTGGPGGRLGRDSSHLPGLMSADDIAALRRLDGVEGARLFLAMLVNHELGALQLANDELAAGRNGDARKLAQTLIDGEQALVRAANELLDGRMHPPGNY